MPELRMMDNLRRIPRGSQDHLLQRHAQREEFRERAWACRSAARSCSRRAGRWRWNRGQKPCWIAGTALRSTRLILPWPTSNFTPRRARPAQIIEQLAVFVDIGHRPAKHVRADVAGAQVLRHQLPVRTLGQEPAEIDHDRNAGQLAGFNRAIHG